MGNGSPDRKPHALACLEAASSIADEVRRTMVDFLSVEEVRDQLADIHLHPQHGW